MKIISRISQNAQLDLLVSDLTKDLKEHCDLGLLFISSFNKDDTIKIASAIRSRLNVKHFLACSCAGIIGSDVEIEREPACSLILAHLPKVNVSPFYLDQSQLDQLKTKEDWYDWLDVYPNENPYFLIFPDPFLIDMNQCITGINRAYPLCPVVGGMASGGMEAKDNTLVINDRIFDEGVIGLSLTGDIHIETIVSQGCRPIGQTYIVTKGEGNVIYELAGRPLVEILEEVLTSAPTRDKVLAEEAIFVGIAMDEYKHQLKRGDFLIRLLMGIDEQSGAGVVADLVRVGQTVQFHIRDAISATEDLHELLRIQRSGHALDTVPHASLIFNCNGRGEGLFREKNHDIHIIQSYIGNLPYAGFFAAGEIGPVGGKNFIHGFTSSIALIYPKSHSITGVKL
jgi:small ligand-binding sensory domain FIST